MKLDPRPLEKRAYELRRHLGLDNTSPIVFDSLKEKIGKITYVEYPLSKGFCGLIYKIDTASAVIIINSNLTLGKQYFTFAHELYHLHYSSEEAKVCTFNEDFMHRKKDKEEVCADIFASFFLMPRFAFLDYFHNECKDETNEESIIKLENHFRANRFTVVARLLAEEIVTEEEADKLLVIDNNKIINMGYSLDLYNKKPNSKTPSISGYYNELCVKLLKENKIGESRYNEILGVFDVDN